MTNTITFGIALLLTNVFLVGCQSAREAASASAAATTISPAVASYGAAYGANNLRQDSLMIVNADAERFSEEIDYERMKALSRPVDMSGILLRPEWKYIGTKQGYHYLAYHPSTLGLRKIYRIHESQYQIDEPMPLSAASWGGRTLQPPEPGPMWINEGVNFRPWAPLQPGTNTFSTNLLFFHYRLNLTPVEAPHGTPDEQ